MDLEGRAVRVGLVTRRFGGENAATTNRLTAYVEAMSSRGADVTVLTRFPFVHLGDRPSPPYRGRLRVRERRAGADVVRTRLPGERFWEVGLDALARIAGRPWGRAALRGSDIVEALYGLLTWPSLLRLRPDVVIVEQGPAWLALPVALVCGSQTPLVLQVSDVKSLAMRNGCYGPLPAERIALAAAAEAWLYRRAHSIVTVTDTMRSDVAARLGRGEPQGRIEIIPNGAELEHFELGDAEGPAATRARLGLSEKFVVAYAGYFSDAHDLDTLIGAAKDLAARGAGDVAFLLVGEGPRFHDVAETVERRGLRNVSLLPSVPVPRLARLLRAADVGVSTEVAGLSERINAKIHGYMAAALPVIATDDGGETRDLLRRLDVGIAVKAGSAEALADAILCVKDDPARFGQGLRGRRWVELGRSRSELASRFARAVLEAAEASPALRAEPRPAAPMKADWVPLLLTPAARPPPVSRADLRRGRLELPPHPPRTIRRGAWHDPPTRDRNWRFQLHSLRFLMATLREGTEEGVGEVHAWIRSWSDASDVEGADSFTWYPHGAAYRALVLAAAALGPACPRADRLRVEREIARHRDFLLDEENFEAGNHGLVEAIALVEAQLTLQTIAGHKVELDAPVREGLERFGRIVESSVSERGVHLEGAPWYQLLFVDWASVYLAHLRRILRRPVLPELDDRIEALRSSLGFFVDPSGRLVPLGDGDAASIEEVRATSPVTADSAPLLDAPGATLFDRQAGHAVFREASPGGRSRHLTFRIPERAPPLHVHNDALSVTLQVDGVDAFIDSGRFSLDHDDPFRRHLTSRHGHNTADVINRGPRDFVPARDPRQLRSAEGMGFRARIDLEAEGFRHRRDVWLPEGEHEAAARIEDVFEGSVGYALRWHLGASLAPRPIPCKRGARWLDPGSGLEISVVADHPFAATCERTEDATDPDGWSSPRWGVREATYVLRVSPSGRGPGPRRVVTTVHRAVRP